MCKKFNGIIQNMNANYTELDQDTDILSAQRTIKIYSKTYKKQAETKKILFPVQKSIQNIL